MRRIDKKKSRLNRFMHERNVRPTDLARETGYSFKHLIELRKGESRPSLASATRILRACERLVGEQLEYSDLFELPPVQRKRAS